MKAIIKNFTQHKMAWIICVLFFGGLFVVGVNIYQDFGVSYDEEAQMVLGEYFYNQYFHHADQIQQGGGNYYYFDSSFDMILHLASQGQVRSKQILTRHLVCFLCFYLGVVAFFFLARRLFHDWKLALLACVFLVVHPRIFADGFYNPKDIPFMVFYIIASLTLFRFIDRPNWVNATIHAFVCGYLTSIRLPGLVMLATTLAFFLYLWLIAPQTYRFRRQFWIVGLYGLLTLAFIILFIPAFWIKPFQDLTNALSLVGNYPWGGKVLYRGDFILATALPWHYLPTWIGITTPIGILIFFGIGIYEMVSLRLNTSDKENSVKPLEGLFLIFWLFFPILSAIILRSTVYDGWRHMFFVYPALVLIAVRAVSGGHKLFPFNRLSGRQYAVLVGLSCLLTVIPPVSFMVRNHPYEYVYFNRLGGENMTEVKSQYDLDYWGLTYLNGLEYIVRSDPSPEIKVKTANPAGELNAYLLTRKNRKRLRFTADIHEADYFITNYRWHPQAYAEFQDEAYSIDVGGASVLSVFNLRK